MASIRWFCFSFLLLLAKAEYVLRSRNPLQYRIPRNVVQLKVHLHHPASGMPNLTRSEIIRKLISKSNVRLHWMIQQHSSSEAKASYTTPLAPDGGGYVMEIQVGTPPQTFEAIIDTSSDLVWVQSQACADCSGAAFRPNSSSTFETILCNSSLCSELPTVGCDYNDGYSPYGVFGPSPCEYFYQYGSTGSGFVGGALVQDTLTLTTSDGNPRKFSSFALGCGLENIGEDGLKGAVGLGQGTISLTSQLATAIDHKFSYCLVDMSSSSASSLLYLGDAAKLSGHGIQWTPIVSNSDYPSYYSLGVEGLTVGGVSVGNPGTTIIDSSTTLTYLADEVYNTIISLFNTSISLQQVDGSYFGLGLCYNTSDVKNYKFPALTINFSGATFSPPSSNYFIVVDDTGDTTCLAIASALYMPVSVIGNVMQQGYHILYDRGSSELSFVKAHCDSL